MKLKSFIPVLAATLAISGVTMAEAGDRSKKNKRERPQQSQQMQGGAAYSVGAGMSTAGRRNAEASGVVASGARPDRFGRPPSTANTVGTGATTADRKSASAAMSTGGTASGSGTAAASSDVDVYAERSRDSSVAETFGGSQANATETTRPRC